MLRNAWISDDAFITMRTVDNFVHGHMLTWNINERVQSYTHPLWLFTVIPFYALLGDPFATLFVLGGLVSLAAVSLLALRLANNTFLAVMGLLALSFSKAFIDYSTSGLENPLTHLILAVFLVLYFRNDNGRKRLFWLTFIASLGMVNRQDTLLLFLPALVYAYWKVSRKEWLTGLTGLAPIVLWELFAVLYYGFPFPNTAYAKLGLAIPRGKLLFHGGQYFISTLKWDPLTLAVIAAAFAAVLISRQRKNGPLLAGMAAYMGYILWIGGDFMSGRFFSVLVFMAVALLVSSDIELTPLVKSLLVLAVIGLGLLSPNPPPLSQPDDERMPMINGIADERLQYFAWTSLPNILNNPDFPDFDWVLRAEEHQGKDKEVRKRESIGFYGYYVGPEVYVIDLNALADPLLARIPRLTANRFRIGHFIRDLPDGYLESIQLGANKISDPDLALYYDKLSVLTKGRLFSAERLLEIVKFNLGAYDHYMDAYLDSPD